MKAQQRKPLVAIIMNKIIFTKVFRLGALFLMLGGFCTAQAQLVADGGSATNSGTFNSVFDLIVGNVGPNTTLAITGGGSVTAGNVLTGASSAASTNNLIVVSGAGSKLTTPGGGSVFRTGNASAFNRLLVSGGGAVTTGFGVIGFPAAASNNSALVTDSGSAWTNNVLYVGENGSGNSLTITNAGIVVANFSTIGVVAGASNNTALVTGANSLWSTAFTVNVGDGGGGSQLRVNSAGTVAATGLVLGSQASSGGNFLGVDGGNVRDTNAAGNAVLDVRRGGVTFNSGNITADNLLVTNAAGSFTFNGGALVTRTATINNGQDFAVGANVVTNAGTAFANNTLINIPIPSAETFGPASPYPSVINVTNVAGNITKLTVTFSNLSHTFPLDIDALLVGPAGQKVMLMSDTGGNYPGVANVTLTFDDAATNGLPAENFLTGTYRPTDYAVGDVFPAPAPSGPYSTALSDFSGSSPNGNWSLYIFDDFNGDVGSLDGWSLNFTTTTPATWDVHSNTAPTVVGNNLIIGSSAANATLLVTNGATLSVGSSLGFGNISRLGANASSSNNLAVIANPGSLWNNTAAIFVGANGSFNTLLITNGGRVVNFACLIGYNSGANNNQVTVSDPNSEWNNSGNLFVGASGSFNKFLITNGGRAVQAISVIGSLSGANSNQVTVTGVNSVWNSSSSLSISQSGSFNTLLITNGGAVEAANAYVGQFAGSGNLLSVGNGTFTVTNATSDAVLDVRRGSAVFNGGNITADQLVLNNDTGSPDALGTFTFNTGTLNARAATVANGSLFTVGNGSSPATYNMSGSITNRHSFADGFNVPANATLTGNGTITGTLVISSGGTLSPGASIGKIIMNDAPYLLGTVAMEISKTGSTLTNDQIQVTGPFVAGGALTVSKIGATALASGDSFKLFNAGSYFGSFSSITLPSLAPGLSWTNTLSLDGTIAVTGTAIVLPPAISSVTKNGTNLSFNVTGGAAGGSWNLLTSTNVALPLTSWITNNSGVFDGAGNVNFTNGINPTEPQRFFRLKTP